MHDLVEQIEGILMLLKENIKKVLINECFESFIYPDINTIKGDCIGAEVLARMVMSDENEYKSSNFLSRIDTISFHWLADHHKKNNSHLYNNIKSVLKPLRMKN